MCVCRGGLLLLMVFANKDLRSHSISGASRLMSNEINTRQLCPVIVASMKGLRILFFLLKFKFYLSVSSPREAVNPYEPLLTFSLPESRDFDASILAGKQAPTKKKKKRESKNYVALVFQMGEERVVYYLNHPSRCLKGVISLTPARQNKRYSDFPSVA